MSDKKKKKKKPESLDHFGSTMGIYPFVRKNNKKEASKSEMEKDIEIYQNDRTIAPDPRMYEQLESEQILREELPEPSIEKMNTGGMGECRGSKAIRGKKFTGVF